MKSELRLRFRALRDAQPPARREESGRAILRAVLGLPEYEAARTVVGYARLGSEANVEPVLSSAQRAGKRVGLPRISGKQLVFHEWAPGDALVSGPAGIQEPERTRAIIADSEVDVVLVPGLAFDRRGARLGYGGGFYDRLLHEAGRAFRVGVAFEVQIVPQLPTTMLDAPMDCVVTESGLLRMPSRRH